VRSASSAEIKPSSRSQSTSARHSSRPGLPFVDALICIGGSGSEAGRVVDASTRSRGASSTGVPEP
jgi:hypothetical protein